MTRSSAAPPTPRPPRGARAASDRLSPEAWIAAALEALAEGGVANVRVEVLARRLKVTKGSFYWHFADRNDLLVQMLESWRLAVSSSVAEMIKRRASDPRERLGYLLKLSTAQRADVPGGPIEQAIREWAKTSEIARAALSRLDGDRLQILTALYRELGHADDAARARSLLFLSYVIGLNLLARDLPDADLARERELCAALLTQAA